MAITSRNPFSGQDIEHYEPMSPDQVSRAIEASHAALPVLDELSFAGRADRMQALARLLDERRDELATTMTLEMGKTLASARSEVDKCAWVCRYYADNAQEHLADRIIPIDGKQAFVRHLPLGVVLAVMPWNFPLWQVFRFLAPALMAGNSAVLKHASNVPGSAAAISKLVADAGFPPGSLSNLLIASDAVEAVIRNPLVRAVTLTGSEAAGRSVAATAASELKKAVLELGGNDSFIVMPSADFDSAVETAVVARTMNNGQSCIAAKRFIVHNEIYDRFRDALVARFEGLKVGDPMASSTDIGPLAMASTLEELDEQVQATISSGARRLTGAHPIPGCDGNLYMPGVIEAVSSDSPAYTDELFGPVASLFRVNSLDQALTLANDSRFGLGSAIFTQDAGELTRAINTLQAGSTFVNAQVASDPRLPFGGIKASCYGRELAEDGIREFVNLKTVVIAD